MSPVNSVAVPDMGASLSGESPSRTAADPWPQTAPSPRHTAFIGQFFLGRDESPESLGFACCASSAHDTAEERIGPGDRPLQQGLSSQGRWVCHED